MREFYSCVTRFSLESTDTTHKPGLFAPGISHVVHAPDGKVTSFVYDFHGKEIGVKEIIYGEDGEPIGYSLLDKETGKLTRIPPPADKDPGDPND